LEHSQNLSHIFFLQSDVQAGGTNRTTTDDACLRKRRHGSEKELNSDGFLAQKRQRQYNQNPAIAPVAARKRRHSCPTNKEELKKKCRLHFAVRKILSIFAAYILIFDRHTLCMLCISSS